MKKYIPLMCMLLAIQLYPSGLRSEEVHENPTEKSQSPHTFTGNVSIVSDYRFRGISQTMREPAIQGGFDYAHQSGIYLGTWASNVDGTTHFYNNTSMEWDLYGGYKGKLKPVPEIAYNLGCIYYDYPGGETFTRARSRYNTVEFYLELGWKWLALKYAQTVTNYFGIHANHRNSRGSIYVEANASFDLLDAVCLNSIQMSKLNLLLHAGHQIVRHDAHLSYTDWKATLTQGLDGFNIFLTYVGTNAKHTYFDVPNHAFSPKKRALGAQGVVCGIVKNF